MRSLYSHRANFGLAWSKAQHEQLQTLLKQGKSIAQAAEIMQRSPDSCITSDRFYRRMDAYINGSDNETLVSWRKRQDD